MRLINTQTLRLESFPDLRRTPPYAILSHTWGSDADEVTFQEMTAPGVLASPTASKRGFFQQMTAPGVLASPTASKRGFAKIRKTCEIALQTRRLKYAWVDTCCIDKTSSAELSEAINSMFEWYANSVVCFALLEDWEPEQAAFDHCRWWTRGWTLQELVAPDNITFFDKTWSVRGDLVTLRAEICVVSRIWEEVLTKERALRDVPVAVRMSWASHRQTTREEDTAYCLMGIFDINMPMLYGEGPKAFSRLQEEIIKTTPDVSLLAWVRKEDAGQAFMGVLAESPAQFSHCSKMVRAVTWTDKSPELKISFSNLGVKTNIRLLNRRGFSVTADGAACLQWAALVYTDENRPPSGIYLKNVGGNRYARAWPGLLIPAPILPPGTLPEAVQTPSIYLLPRLSGEDSAACTTRQLTFRTPWAKLVRLENMSDLSIHPPNDKWHLETNQCLQVSLDRTRTTVMSFLSADVEEASNFMILCRFEVIGWGLFVRGFWECDVIKAGDNLPMPGGIERHQMALSGDDLSPIIVSKTLDVTQERAWRKGRKSVVTVTLERQHTGPEWDPVPMFFLDVRMDVSKR